MRGSRRRSSKISAAVAKPAPAAPPPGRFTDQLAQCVTCGRPFVFTVEEQRQLADAGLPVEPPEQCPRCAPRAATVDERPRTDDRPRVAEPRVAPPPAPPSPPQPAREAVAAPWTEPPPRPAPRPPSPAHRSEVDEFAGHYTVLSYGHVKAYDAERGVGTVVDDDSGHEYRVYHSALEGVKNLTPGQAVEFEVVRKGRDAEAAHVLPV